MTDDDAKIEEALKKCTEAHLPDDFADRLVERIRKGETPDGKSAVRGVFVRIALVAASLTLLLGFVPNVFESQTDVHAHVVAHKDEIRPMGSPLSQDSQLNVLAFLGFFRDVIRRRVKPLTERHRRRRDEE